MARKPAENKTASAKAATAPAKPRTTTTRRRNAAPAPVITVTHDQIAARAYEIWLSKGRPWGQDAANWREAEAQLHNA